MICEGTTTIIDGQDVGTPGDYVSNLLTTFGCDSIVTITLELVPDQGIEADVIPIQPACFDSESGSVLLGSVENAYEPFEVFIDGELIPNFVETILPPDNYTMTIVDTFGCSYSEEFSLVLPDIITLDIGDDVTLSLGDQLEITPSANFLDPDYTASSEFTCSADCNTLTFLPINSQSLIVEAIDENLCTVSDTLSITVTKDRKIFIPNIFCPSCGQNDVFYIQGVAASVSAIQSFQVYDRWGNKLYDCTDGQLNDPNCGWDGTYNGQDINPGVYVYVAEISFIDEEVLVFSGDLTLIR
jgi:gliding motility-associated-like protein